MRPTLPAFEVLVELARNDPQGLEALRGRLTGAIIDAARTEVARQRLRGLQFKVEMECKKAANPLAACIRVSELMCRSLADLQRSMLEPETFQPEPDDEVRAVVPFPGDTG